MNNVAKCVVAASVAGLMAVPLCACGIDATGDVSVANRTVEVQGQLYLTQGEVDQAKTLLTSIQGLGFEDDGGASMASLLDNLQEVELGGATYLTNDNLKVPSPLSDGSAAEQGALTAADLAQNGVIFDDDKLVVSQVEASEEELAGSASSAGLDLGGIGAVTGIANANDLTGKVDYYRFALTFDKTPVASNGAIDGNTVTFTDPDTRQYYVTFDSSVLDENGVGSSIKNKAYTKKRAVTYTTKGIISTFTVNGTEGVAPSLPDASTGAVSANTAALPAEGKNTVVVNLLGQDGTPAYAKTFTYHRDTKKPTANVKKGKTYKKGYKLVVKDAQALKSVKLDGKALKASGKKATKAVKKAGSHKLVAKDKAGNKVTVKFKIKKK